MTKKVEVLQEDKYDCAAASLLSLIRYYGGNMFIEDVRRLINTTKMGTNAYDLISGAKTIGFDGMGEKVSFKELIKELYNIEGEENIKEFLWDKVKEVNKLMPKYKYVREMIITEEPLVKTTTLKIKRHEELKKVLGK